MKIDWGAVQIIRVWRDDLGYVHYTRYENLEAYFRSINYSYYYFEASCHNTEVLGDWLGQVVKHERWWSANGPELREVRATYYIKNEYDERYPRDWIIRKYHEFRAKHYPRRHLFSWDYKYRDGPVPHTRKYRGGGRWGHRWFRSYNVLRNNEAVRTDEDCKEYRITVRGKQRNHPNLWDDLPVGDFYRKSWKHYRRQQWKPK